MLRAAGLFLVLSVIGLSSPALADGDAALGKKVFRKCAACHKTENGKHQIGPSLADLFGRQAGTAAGYKYSKAMVQYGASGVTWNADSLFSYLEAPRSVVKGTKMAFPGLAKEEDRRNLIAYLKQFSKAE